MSIILCCPLNKVEEFNDLNKYSRSKSQMKEKECVSFGLMSSNSVIIYY